MRQDRITRRICALPLYEVDQDVRNYDPDARIIPRTSRESFQARIIDMRRHGGRTLFGVHQTDSRAINRPHSGTLRGRIVMEVAEVGWRSLGLWSASGEGGDRVIHAAIWKFVSVRLRCLGRSVHKPRHDTTIGVIAAAIEGQDGQFNFTLFSHGCDFNAGQCNLSSGTSAIAFRLLVYAYC